MKRFILPPVITAVAAGVLASPYIELVAGTRNDERLVPGAANLEEAAFLIALLMPIVLAVVLAILRPTKGRSRRFKLLYIPGVLLAQFAITIALFAASFTLDFEGDPIASVRSPDGAHTAYLFEGGIMCGYSVSVAKTGALRMRSVGGYGLRCDAQGGYSIHWSSPTQIALSSGINVVKVFGLPKE